MPAIVIASSRKGDAARPLEVWGDVIMALNSVTLYAPDQELVLAWQGPCEPEGMLSNPRMKLVRQPDSCASYGEAYGFAVGQTPAEELVLMNDDAVLTPTSMEQLLGDAALIREQHPQIKIGFLACRTNFVPGPQNVRAPNDGQLLPSFMRYDSEERILAAERVSPILAYVPRQALGEIGGFPPINWFSDDLMCFDLIRKGYTNFVSRAYVHHIGQRSTTQDGTTAEELHRRGREWVKQNRPDFWKAIGGD
jgi:hypothetical protein